MTTNGQATARVTGRRMRAVPEDVTKRRRTRVVPNLFGIPFGIAGLADVWAVAQPVLATPPTVTHARTCCEPWSG